MTDHKDYADAARASAAGISVFWVYTRVDEEDVKIAKESPLMASRLLYYPEGVGSYYLAHATFFTGNSTPPRNIMGRAGDIWLEESGIQLRHTEKWIEARTERGHASSHPLLPNRVLMYNAIQSYLYWPARETADSLYKGLLSIPIDAVVFPSHKRREGKRALKKPQLSDTIRKAFYLLSAADIASVLASVLPFRCSDTVAHSTSIAVTPSTLQSSSPTALQGSGKTGSPTLQNGLGGLPAAARSVHEQDALAVPPLPGLSQISAPFPQFSAPPSNLVSSQISPQGVLASPHRSTNQYVQMPPSAPPAVSTSSPGSLPVRRGTSVECNNKGSDDEGQLYVL